MSIECDNTTPLGSKNAPELLSENSTALIDAILDLTDIANVGVTNDANGTSINEFANPLVTIDQRELAETTNLLNNILANTPLDAFPNLQDKLSGTGGRLSATDLAEASIDLGLDVTSLKDDLSDYNTNLPQLSTPGAITEDSTRTITTATGSELVSDPKASRLNANELISGDGAIADSGVITATDPTGLTTGTTVGSGSGSVDTDPNDTGSGTGTGSTGAGSAPITTASSGTGTGGVGSTTVGGVTTSGTTINTGSSDTPILGTDATRLSQRVSTPVSTPALSTTSPSANNLARNVSTAVSAGAIYGAVTGAGGLATILPVPIFDLLNKLDFHSATNIGQKLSQKVCGAYSDVLAELTKFTNVVNSGKDTLTKISNVLEKDVKKLAESIKQRGVLQTLMDILEQIIEAAIKAAKGVVVAALGSVLAVVKGIASASKAIMTKVAKITRDIQNYMKDASVAKIIADMEKLVAELASSFERLTPQNIANLMFRLCQMAQDLQAKLMQPALDLNKFAQTMGSQTRAINSANAKQVQSAVKYGAIRVSDEDRKAKQKSATSAINQSASPSNTEAVYVDSKEMSETEMGLLLGIDENGIGGVVSFGPELTKEDALGKQPGWENVNQIVWQRMIRTSAQTGEEYTVTKGYVRPVYSSLLKRKVKSAHSTGYAIDIQVTPKIRKDTIVAASRAGFTAISVYPDYITLALSRRRSHLSNQFSGQEAQELSDLLDKHNIDGFKIKRT
jgi:hypothetical protein